MSFNATVRRLTGTPSTAGTYDMTYRVRDIDGDTDSLTFAIAVQEAADGGPVGSFDLHEDNSWPTGIAHADGRFHVLDSFDDKVYAYTDTGERDASTDFDLDDDNFSAGGIAHANGRLFVVDSIANKVFAYSVSGDRDASADFDLSDHNKIPEGIAFANGRLYVVDAGVDRVYAYPVPTDGSAATGDEGSSIF
ncbi:MAG: hypothetical protein OXI73_01670 [Rhodospirillales bacterium]|nr:hypothetical protein [Rhodospirillales bacterium]